MKSIRLLSSTKVPFLWPQVVILSRSAELETHNHRSGKPLMCLSRVYVETRKEGERSLPRSFFILNLRTNFSESLSERHLRCDSKNT
jgi:hypothetical protein